MHKPGGGSINSCDVVALEYKTGWWFSCHDHNVGEACTTRTCPGEEWVGGGGNWDRCTFEKFRIRAKGQDCGSPIRDGSVVVIFTNESKGVVGKRKTCTDRCISVGDTVETGNTDPSYSSSCLGGSGWFGPCATWRSYNMEFLLRVKKD